MHLLHLDLLVDPRTGGNPLDSRRQAAHLILPTAACAHDLLHSQYNIVDIRILCFPAQQLIHPFYAGARQDAAGSQPGSLGNPHHTGGKPEAAPQPATDFHKRRFSRQRYDAAGDQRRLVQGKRIVGIMAVLYLLHPLHAAAGPDIRAGKLHAMLFQTLHLNLHRKDPIQLKGRIQHGPAAFIAVGRRIRPAASPIDPNGQLHFHPLPFDPIVS